MTAAKERDTWPRMRSQKSRSAAEPGAAPASEAGNVRFEASMLEPNFSQTAANTSSTRASWRSLDTLCVTTLPYPPCLLAAAAALERERLVRSYRRASRSKPSVRARRSAEPHSRVASSRIRSASSVAARPECEPSPLQCSAGASNLRMGFSAGSLKARPRSAHHPKRRSRAITRNHGDHRLRDDPIHSESSSELTHAVSMTSSGLACKVKGPGLS
eukprot:scaffold103895_cov29-Tisochrysis_lutea.AAC.7